MATTYDTRVLLEESDNSILWQFLESNEEEFLSFVRETIDDHLGDADTMIDPPDDEDEDDEDRYDSEVEDEERARDEAGTQTFLRLKESLTK